MTPSDIVATLQEPSMDDPNAFHAALGRASVVLFTQDARLRYTWVHSPAFGDSPDIIGKTDADLAPHEVAAALTAVKSEVLRSGKGTRQEIRLELPVGTRYYDLTVEPVRDEGGAVAGITGAAVDVTERVTAQQELLETARQLRAAHATFNHLVQNSPFGIYAVDADFRLVTVSAGAQKVFATVRPLIGRDFAEVLRILWPEPFATEAIGRFVHTLATGETYRAPATVERRKDIGEVESYDWKVERVVLPDGRFGAVCHFYDLSERQRYEAALQEADQRKDEFLAMLAHELRNPLSAISNAVQLLRRLQTPEPDAIWAAELIARQVAHLTRMVDDLLDVSRVTQSQLTMKKEAVPVAVPVGLAQEIVRGQFEAKNQALKIDVSDEPIVVECDTARLAQSVANLLHNASKFTPDGGEVRLSVTRADGAMVLRVRDTGSGIAPHLLPRIFDVFVQGDQSLDRTQGGLGLGLTIARRLVQIQGGSLEAVSDGVGLGSEFILRMPIVEQPVPVRAPAASNPERTSRRILLVDDHADALEGMERILRLMGNDVRGALDGEEALRVAAAFRPEMVVLDIGLPGMDGYEVARRMRVLPGLQGTTLVALTGYGQHEDRQRARAAGFDHHLLKPALPEAVLAPERAKKVLFPTKDVGKRTGPSSPDRSASSPGRG